jgi:glycerophosphoryl diester phosphodiesterase
MSERIVAMKHEFFRAPRPRVFAHRGGAALAPENTMAAFDRGLALGADGLEIDVRLSRDGVVVVHHDATLARTTDCPRAVRDLTADELAAVDAGFRFEHDGCFPYRGKGIGVPTLAAVLERHASAPVVIELKVNDRRLAEAAVDVVRKAGAVERVCIGSFDRGVLRAVRLLDPRIATSAAREEVRWALYRSWCRWPSRRTAYSGYQVPEWSGRTRIVSPRFVRMAQAAGLGVQVWTVNDEAEGERLLRWGVNDLISDRPDVLVPLVRRRGRQ